jgi:glutaredoxin
MAFPLEDTPVLLVKPGCESCEQAVSFLDGRGIGYQQRDFEQDGEARKELRRLGTAEAAPALIAKGHAISGFDPAAWADFLRKLGYRLEES